MTVMISREEQSKGTSRGVQLRHYSLSQKDTRGDTALKMQKGNIRTSTLSDFLKY